MKYHIPALLLTLMAIPALTFGGQERPGGRETNNGGDPVAIEFANNALEAIHNVRREHAKYPELQFLDLTGTLSEAQILVVEGELTVEKDGIVTHPAATNSKNPARIQIARAKWKELYDLRAKQSLALHEVLSLAGVEETGVYKIVQRYQVGASKPIHYPRAWQGWKFRRPTAEEQKRYAGIMPNIPGFEAPEEIESISDTQVFLPVYDEAVQTRKEMSIRVLEYSLEYIKGDEDSDFSQLVVTDARGKIYSSSVILPTSNFTLSANSTTGDININWIDTDQKGRPANFYRTLKGGHEWNESFGFEAEFGGLKDWVSVDDNRVGKLVLGKPSAKKPYGLYELWGYEHRLIRPFTSRIPGYEGTKDIAGAYVEPRYVTESILGVYHNDRGTFALLNDLNGVVSVNVKTKEIFNVYEVPEEGRFAYPLKVESRAGNECTELRIGIYTNEQGPAFYSGDRHGSSEDFMLPGRQDLHPYYIINLGVVANQELFHTRTDGCGFPKEQTN